MLYEPLAYELLGELLLGLTLLELLLITLGVEITAGVGGMNLVNEDDLAVALAKLILGIYKDEPLAGGNLRATLEEGAGVFHHRLPVLTAHETLGYDFLGRDVLVVTFLSLGGGGDDGLGEPLVLAHAFGQLHATQFAASVLVLTPGTARQVATDDHLHTEALGLQTHGHHGVGRGQFPVGHDVGRSIQEAGSNLVQALALEGDSLGQDDIEGRDTVGSHHDHEVIVDVVHVTDFTMIHAHLSRQVEVSSCQCIHFLLVFIGS